MIPIKKTTSPTELEELRNEATKRHLSPKDAYKTLCNPLKTIVLEQLLREQGHLCAYCMRRIPDVREMPDSVKKASIEHYYPLQPLSQDNRGQGLDYQNMLAVCSGNRGKKHTRKRKDFTCDARRNNKSILTVNPTDATTLQTIYYCDDGRIAASDATIHHDLTVELNLNCSSDAVQLPLQRQNALIPLQHEIAELLLNHSREAIRQFCKTRLQQFQNEQDPKTEYVGIIIWWLNGFINDLATSSSYSVTH